MYFDLGSHNGTEENISRLRGSPVRPVKEAVGFQGI